MVLGGMPVAGISFGGAERHQLPGAQSADAAFSSIVTADNTPIDDNWRNARCAALLDLFHAINPDTLLIEQFPFGRRQFRFELIPLLEAARQRPEPPNVLCSVRDLLVNKKKPERSLETADTINRFFDNVLVHGDRNFLPLEASFDETGKIQDKLVYTGYVTPEPNMQGSAGTDEVIVAAGGGAVGGPLLKTAIAARSLSALSDKTWRILVGPNLDPVTRHDLEHPGSEGVVIEANREDYTTLLANCSCSISQAGYNTLMDIVRVKCPAVVVPFSAGDETEQAVRARLLSERNYVTWLAESELSPLALASAVDSAVTQNRPDTPPFSVNGASETARFMTSS